MSLMSSLDSVSAKLLDGEYLVMADCLGELWRLLHPSSGAEVQADAADWDSGDDLGGPDGVGDGVWTLSHPPEGGPEELDLEGMEELVSLL